MRVTLDSGAAASEVEWVGVGWGGAQAHLHGSCVTPGPIGNTFTVVHIEPSRIPVVLLAKRLSEFFMLPLPASHVCIEKFFCFCIEKFCIIFIKILY